jgi:hypothetical protein
MEYFCSIPLYVCISPVLGVRHELKSACYLMPVAKPCRILVKFGVGVLYKMLLSKRDFRLTRLSDNHTLLKGIKTFLPVVSVFLHPL